MDAEDAELVNYEAFEEQADEAKDDAGAAEESAEARYRFALSPRTCGTSARSIAPRPAAVGRPACPRARSVAAQSL